MLLKSLARQGFSGAIFGGCQEARLLADNFPGSTIFGVYQLAWQTKKPKIQKKL